MSSRRTGVSSLPVQPEKTDYKLEILWPNLIFFAFVHVISVYGAYLAMAAVKWHTILWAYLLFEMTTIGVAAGVHRLWSHRSYKAKWPLQIFLAYCFTIGHQKSIYKWVRDHRVHHKYSDTDADPHNINRGVFFAHIGWILCKKLPLAMEKGRMEDLSDLKANPIVMFQHNHYYKITPIVSWLIPTIVPMYGWNEGFVNSFCVATVLRYCLTLHLTFLINSLAHSYGNRPYDRSICAVNNRYMFLPTFGEGWHNYHHVFPWDYRSVEVACTQFNFTKVFIEFMASIGQAWDLKVAPQQLVERRMARTGGTDLEYTSLLPKKELQYAEEEDEAGCIIK